MSLNEIVTALYRARVRREKALVMFLDARRLGSQTLALAARETEFAGADIVGLRFAVETGEPGGAADAHPSTASQPDGFDRFFAAAAIVRRRVDLPIVACLDHPPVDEATAAEIAGGACDCGLDGVMLPGLEGEATARARRALEARGVEFIHYVKPQDGQEVISDAAFHGRGLIYIESRPGDGLRRGRCSQLNSAVESLKRCADAYIVVGLRKSVFPLAVRAAARADGLALFGDFGEGADGSTLDVSVDEVGRMVAAFKNGLVRN